MLFKDWKQIFKNIYQTMYLSDLNISKNIISTQKYKTNIPNQLCSLFEAILYHFELQ